MFFTLKLNNCTEKNKRVEKNWQIKLIIAGFQISNTHVGL